MRKIDDLREFINQFSTAPSLADMPRKTLEDKGVAGATAAHFIEEIHTPFNIDYVTFTTGSTAFQNIVGVTYDELPGRMAASKRALKMCGAQPGQSILFAYPPLVNVFYNKALLDYGLNWFFLERSQREALILALCENKPQILVGESTFIRATITDAVKMGMMGDLPRGLIVLAAGTPLDLELIEEAKPLGWQIHDIYGCQEFGWLTLDGILLRDDITLCETEPGFCALIVGGLPTGDSFPVSSKGHILNRRGEVITYKRLRTAPEYVVVIEKTFAESVFTVERLAKTILRIKGRMVMVSPDLQTGCRHTGLKLVPFVLGDKNELSTITINGPEKTLMFDSLLHAQLHYQSQSKKDPTWIKDR